MRSGILFVLAIALLASCSSTKQIGSLKINAETLEQSGDSNGAVNAWKAYFEETAIEDVAGADFAQAAKSAFKADQTELAISWFDQARYKNYADAAMYQSLAEIYHSQDNLSKELSALEYYTDNFGTDNAQINARLFLVYTEISDFNKAIEAWSGMKSEDKNTENFLVDYLEVNKKLENESVCDSVAEVLLSMNSNQFEALDWMAKKYYWDGQNRYNAEMKKYEQNKTRKQYNILVKELEKVTADFKKALPYLENLWEQKPGKEYAGYFANIYARFGDEQKAEYYKKYMNQ